MPEDKYLKHYAEPLARDLDLSGLGSFDQVLVIPACREKDFLPACLDSAFASAAPNRKNLLLILVLNHRENPSEETAAENRATLAELTAAPGSEKGPMGSWMIPRAHGTVLILDYVSPGRHLPADQGVGLARKLGCDLAFALWHQGSIKSPWLRSSDADALFGADYLADLPAHGHLTGVTFPYRHLTQDMGLSTDAEHALALYELHLRSHRLGLVWAGSPYGFHTIGSTMAFTCSGYAKVRGFPKRQAGEDFYLLNKLAKVGDILLPKREPVLLRGRPSDRVPFGTGPAMAAIAETLRKDEDYSLYHPHLYRLLRALLKDLESAAAGHGEFALLKNLEGGDLARTVFAELGGRKVLAEIRKKSLAPKVGHKRLQDWFDGLKTIRFFHLLRDDRFPSPPWHEALADHPALGGERPEEDTISGWSSLLEALEREQQGKVQSAFSGDALEP